ncbi:MAG: sodium:phosphate symporter [Halorientalis sp.]
MSGAGPRDLGWVPSSLWLLGATAVAVALFLFAVQLLGATTRAAAPTLRRVLTRIVVGEYSALGLSWLAAYGLGNGSVVAALALSLFSGGLVTTSQLFLMVAGSRLGAAAIVVFIGALEYVQKRRFSLQESVSMGLLTFLLTYSIYVPATVIGYLLLPVTTGPVRAVGPVQPIEGGSPPVFAPINSRLIASLGPPAALVLAVVVLFASLQLFDRILSRIDTQVLRAYLFRHFRRRWLSFGLGVLITILTTSVAFSLGVIVPLYNRNYVTRGELMPYVLGANLGTIVDSLVVALVLPTPVGVATVLLLLVVSSAVTLLALAGYEWYASTIERIDTHLRTDRRAFVVFVISLVLGPLTLVVVPLAVGYTP